MAHNGSNRVRFCSDDIPERNRVAYVRDVYGKVVNHDIEPDGSEPFYWQSTLQNLPNLDLAWTVCSAVQTRRTKAQVNSDDLVVNITLAGLRTVRQFGREAVVSSGELALTRSLFEASCACESGSHLVNIRVPVSTIAPQIGDLDALLVRTIPADSEHVRLLLGYVSALADSSELNNPAVRHVVATHVQDLLALVLDASRQPATAPLSRHAARLRAIKDDVLAGLARNTLSVDAVAKRHGITSRYLRMLFHDEGTSFTDFVLDRRLELARRMLSDPRHSAQAIGAIALASGFGDLSYFNRAFRRRFGATPSQVREAASRGD
jgi:AraC-like DNA-binding protein